MFSVRKSNCIADLTKRLTWTWVARDLTDKPWDIVSCYNDAIKLALRSYWTQSATAANNSSCPHDVDRFVLLLLCFLKFILSILVDTSALFTKRLPVKWSLKATQVRIDIQSRSLFHVQSSVLLQALIYTTWISYGQCICQVYLGYLALVQSCVFGVNWLYQNRTGLHWS